MAPRRYRSIALATAVSSALAAAAVAALPAGAAAGDHPVTTDATMAVPALATDGFTYDPAQVPVGSRVRVHAVETGGGKTVVTMQVKGLLPERSYGAHAHVAACGATGAAAGGHYQYLPGVVSPENEVWLDFTTDADGNGSAQTVVDWEFAPATARSVTLHALPTDPTTGGAGARLGCVTVAF